MFFLVLLLPLFISAQFVSWAPPHGQIVNAYVYNATEFYLTHQDRTVYIAQVGLDFRGTKGEAEAVVRFLQQMCRYVVVDILERRNVSHWEELWVGDIYCTENGTMWLWLKWLPLRFSAYIGVVNFVNVSTSVYTPVGTFAGYVPEGWYLDLRSKAVIKLPHASTDLFEELRRLSEAVTQLRVELQRAREERDRAVEAVRNTSERAAQLEDYVKRLEAALQARESVIRSLELRLRATAEEAETLKRRLEETRAQLEETKAALKKTNETAYQEIEKWKLRYESVLSQCGVEQVGFSPLWATAIIATAVATAAIFVILRRRGGE